MLKKTEKQNLTANSGRSSFPDTQARIFIVHHPVKSPSHPGNHLSFTRSIGITSSGVFCHSGLLYFGFCFLFWFSTFYICYAAGSRVTPLISPRHHRTLGLPAAQTAGHGCGPMKAPGVDALSSGRPGRLRQSRLEQREPSLVRDSTRGGSEADPVTWNV